MYQRCLSILLCGAFFILAGCSEDKNPPRIIVISPLPDALNAPRSGVVAVQFNEELRESSISDNALIVEHNGIPLSGEVVFDPALNSISFRSDEPLFFLRQYDARLSGGISDLKGNTTDQAGREWSFWVNDGVFSASILIENDAARNAVEPQVAYGPGGHGHIVWSQTDGTRFNIWARSLTRLSLGTSLMIETNNAGNAGAPQVAVDSQGNAIAVWSQSDGTRTNIWTNRYTPPADGNDGGSWGTAVIIDTEDLGDATAPQIAYAADGGSAIAVWSQSDGTRTNIWSSRYSSGSWSTAAIIDNDNTDATAPQVVMDSNNNVIAIWAQNNRIYENRHVAGVWGTAAPIDNAAGTATASPQIAVDPDGNAAIAVWSQTDGSAISSIWANRFDGNVWGTAETIETDSGNANTPQIAMNQSGTAIAVWSQSFDSRFRIRASRFTPATGWEAPATIDNYDPRVFIDDISEEGISTKPQVALDDDGNALVLWILQGGDSRFVGATRYRGPLAHETLRGWLGGGIIGLTGNVGDADNPQIALAPDFTGVAVWSKEDGDEVSHIEASAFN